MDFGGAHIFAIRSRVVLQCAYFRTPCEVVQCEKRYGTELAPWPSSWTSLEALTARFDSRGYQVDGRLRPRVEGAG